MALMKWGKYNVVTSNLYYNPRSASLFLYNWSHDGSQYVSGYDNWGFDSSIGFYDDGNYISDVSVFTSTATAVYIDQTVESDTIPGYYTVDRYLVQECDVSSTSSKGTFIEEVIAESGTYPEDGSYGAYWYVLIGAAFFTMKCEIDSVLKTGVDGWCKIDGTLKKIAGGWIKVDGVLKQLK